MPVTPFHFGPGGLITVVTRGYVSFLAFCASNVLIDVESLYNMLTRQPRIHSFLHTYVGATIAAAIVVLGFYPARRLARKYPASPLITWRELPVSVVVAGALLGAWSHVVFDSIMHSDITPLAPFSNANVLYRVISLRTLHLFCAGAGALALAWWLLRRNTSPVGTRRD
jgi:membrane-bound metal-dependent hydrolase YbcI (DUF457 family)